MNATWSIKRVHSNATSDDWLSVDKWYASWYLRHAYTERAVAMAQLWKLRCENPRGTFVLVKVTRRSDILRETVDINKEAIAKAHGWRSWHDLEHDSRRDGYSEAGGMGALASAIARSAAYAQRLIELVEEHELDRVSIPDAMRTEITKLNELLKP